ncbi:hypothetical protein ES705_24833 [subsurface metagenome]
MRIKIYGTESLGVRGLSCLVETQNRKVFIDPGLALGFRRHGLEPHPVQIGVGERVRLEILDALKECTDIVFSHFHGDHVPLVHANPYQLAAQQAAPLFKKPHLWCKSTHDISGAMARRFNGLSELLGRTPMVAEGKKEGALSFSLPVPHGEARSRLGTVMMTRIEDEGSVFVHASDSQLVESETVSQILEWHPDIVFVSGPPVYLQNLASSAIKAALHNAEHLAQGVELLIVDHHLLRCEEGYRFLDDLGSVSGQRVICAADYMGKQRLPLEAWRRRLYGEMPVPVGWHRDYAKGKVGTGCYKNWEAEK